MWNIVDNSGNIVDTSEYVNQGSSVLTSTDKLVAASIIIITVVLVVLNKAASEDDDLSDANILFIGLLSIPALVCFLYFWCVFWDEKFEFVWWTRPLGLFVHLLYLFGANCLGGVIKDRTDQRHDKRNKGTMDPSSTFDRPVNELITDTEKQTDFDDLQELQHIIDEIIEKRNTSCNNTTSNSQNGNAGMHDNSRMDDTNATNPQPTQTLRYCFRCGSPIQAELCERCGYHNSKQSILLLEEKDLKCTPCQGQF